MFQFDGALLLESVFFDCEGLFNISFISVIDKLY